MEGSNDKVEEGSTNQLDQGAINKFRSKLIFDMLKTSDLTVNLNDPEGSAFGLVYIITAPHATGIEGPDENGNAVPYKKFVCKLLFGNQDSIAMNTASASSSSSSSSSPIIIDVDLGSGANIVYKKEITTRDNVLKEAENQSQVYQLTVINGQPICPDIVTVLEFNELDTIRQFLSLLKQIPLDLDNTNKSTNHLFTEALLNVIQERNLVTRAIFMECVAGYDPSLEIYSLGTMSNIVPVLSGDEKEYVYCSSIAQILLTIIVNNGTKYNLDNNTKNIIIALNKDILITSLIDFGIILDETNIHELMELCSRTYSRNPVKSSDINTKITQCVEKIQSICSRIKQQGYQVINPELVLNILQPLLIFCQLCFEIKYNWDHSNMGWVIDFLSYTGNQRNIDRSIVRNLKKELDDEYKFYGQFNSEYSITRDPLLPLQILKSKNNIIRLKLALRNQNMMDITRLNESNVNPKIAELIIRFMTNQSQTFNPQTVSEAQQKHQYYEGGLYVVTSEDFEDTSDLEEDIDATASGSSMDNTGSSMDNTGSSMDNSGSSSDSNSGSSMVNTGSSMDNSGSSMDNSGSSMVNTGSNSSSSMDNSGSSMDNSGSSMDNSGSSMVNTGSSSSMDS